MVTENIKKTKKEENTSKKSIKKRIKKIIRIAIPLFLIFLLIIVAFEIRKHLLIKEEMFYFFKNDENIDAENSDIKIKIKDNSKKYKGKKIFFNVNKRFYPDYVYYEIIKNAKIAEETKSYSLKKYVELLVDLPWFEEAEENRDLENIKKILNETHIGLDSVKENIVEFLAYEKFRNGLKNNKGNNSKILCLFGPPGVGKTTIAKTIAKALHRPFKKISLAGTFDAATIHGMNKYYVNAECGKIMKAINESRVNNPVILIDEAEKVATNSQHGNPLLALLEVFDSAQNKGFRDRYVEVPFDLSNVFFILTVNSLSNLSHVPYELIDRIEVINIPCYNNLQKKEVIKKAIIPGYKKELNLDIVFDEEAINHLVFLSQNCFEGGIRGIKKRIDLLVKKELKKKMLDNVKIKNIKKIEFNKEKVDLYLKGSEPAKMNIANKEDEIGKINSMCCHLGFLGGVTKIGVLCYESEKNGGELLTNEAGFSRDDSSGKIACSRVFHYLTKNSSKYNISKKKILSNTFVLQISDSESSSGPSLSLAVFICMISALKNIPIRGDVAITGVLDQFGNVKPIGGVYDKVTCSYDLGFRHFILPKKNAEDVNKIPKKFIDGAHFYFVEKPEEALKIILKK